VSASLLSSVRARLPRWSLALIALLVGFILAGCDGLSPDPAVINGAVISDVNGRAIPAAVVHLLGSNGQEVLQETLTGDDGRFSFSVRVDTSATFRVRAFKLGEFEVEQQVITVRAEQILTLPNFRLAPTVGEIRPATISGSVVDDSTGVPLAQVAIRVEDVERRRVLTEVQTGADGSFALSLSLAESRDLRITASREGFETRHLDLRVEASETYRVGDLRLIPAGPGVLSGLVVDATTGQPVAGASVSVKDLDRQVVLREVTTGSGGAFLATLPLAGPTRLGVTVSAEGYDPVAREVTLTRGQTIVLDDTRLQAIAVEARSITLVSRTADAVGVSNSGTRETSTLTFVVLDGNGRPLNTANSVRVRFEIVSGPSSPGQPGAESVFPAEAMTDATGQVSVTLTSGTRAGVVQVQAAVDTPGTDIRSQPVVIAIHGGFPVAGRFGVYPERLNVFNPGVAGQRLPISVTVADEYGNPVTPGTAVYFTTDYWLIEGSAATDSEGRATVQLISGQPFSPDGRIRVEARTFGRDGAPIIASTTVLYSGETRVVIEYLGGQITDEGGRRYRYRVTDPRGNPIQGGSTATVTVTGNRVKAMGAGVQVTIPDAIEPGPRVTEFEFSVGIDGSGGQGTPELNSVGLTVSSPNGNVTLECPPAGCASRPSQ
jgi:5-hydroxyisourate hydrolase-like protein (transthyretin family)